MNILGIRAETRDRHALMQHEMPPIREPGRGVIAQRTARDIGEMPLRHAYNRRLHVKDAGLGHETLEFQLDLGAAQLFIRARCRDQLFDIGFHSGSAIAHHDTDAQPDPRPRRHGRIPFAAFNRAKVYIHRMVHAMEGRMDVFGAVHPGLIFLEIAGDGGRRFNGIQPSLHIAHMGGATGNRHPGPNHADFGTIHGGQARAWFGDDHGIGRRQRQHGGQGTIAGAFFFNNGMHLHLGCRLQASALQGAKGSDIRYDARLHITRATAKHAAIANTGLIGRRFPHIRRPFRHHIHMALQRQAAPLGVARREDRNDIIAPLIGNQRRGKTGMAFKRSRHGWNALRCQAKPLINPRHFIERRSLIAKR